MFLIRANTQAVETWHATTSINTHNLPETDVQPPGRNRWWRSSNPPKQPAILHTARQTQKSALFERKYTRSLVFHRVNWSCDIIRRWGIYSQRWGIWSETAQCRTCPGWQPLCGGSWPGWEPIGSPESQTPASGGLPPRERWRREGKGGHITTDTSEEYTHTHKHKCGHMQIWRTYKHNTQEIEAFHTHTRTQWQGHTYTGLPQLFPW